MEKNEFDLKVTGAVAPPPFVMFGTAQSVSGVPGPCKGSGVCKMMPHVVNIEGMDTIAVSFAITTMNNLPAVDMVFKYQDLLDSKQDNHFDLTDGLPHPYAITGTNLGLNCSLAADQEIHIASKVDYFNSLNMPANSRILSANVASYVNDPNTGNVTLTVGYTHDVVAYVVFGNEAGNPAACDDSLAGICSIVQTPPPNSTAIPVTFSTIDDSSGNSFQMVFSDAALQANQQAQWNAFFSGQISDGSGTYTFGQSFQLPAFITGPCGINQSIQTIPANVSFELTYDTVSGNDYIIVGPAV
jgi:hypothetical protein